MPSLPFLLLLSLVASASSAQAADVDERTTGIWTNYLNSKFSINGPNEEEWSRKQRRGQTADDLVEEDLRRDYYRAVASQDLARQKKLIEDLQGLKPEDPQYRQWMVDYEKRVQGEARKSRRQMQKASGGSKDLQLGRLQVAQPGDLYFWEALSLPAKSQEPLLEKFQTLRRERASWREVNIEATAMPRDPAQRRIRVEPITLDQAGELSRILKEVAPAAPPPDLMLLSERNRGTKDQQNSLARLAKTGRGTGSPGSADEPTFSFTAKAMPLVDALALFGKLNNLNILPDPDATGLLTVDFRGLSLDKALDAMLLNFGYYAEEEGGLIRVRAMETRRFVIDYPRALREGTTTTQGSVSLPSVSSGGGGGGGSGGGGGGGSGGGGGGGGGGSSGDSSSISITTEDSLDMWKTIIGHVRTLLSETDASQASSLGGATGLATTTTVDTTTAGAVNSSMIDFRQAEAYMQQFKKGPRLFADSVSGVVVVRDKRENVQAIAEYLEDLRKSLHRQVDLNVKVYSVEFTDGRELAIDWNQVAVVAGNTAITATAALSPATLPAAFASPNPLTLTVQNSKLNMVIKAIEEQGKLKLLTQPRIRTLNHQPAVVKIQRTTPFFVSQSNLLQSQSGNAQGNNVQVNNVTTGTLLSITPQIAENGVVALDIIPVVSRIIRTDSFVQPTTVTNSVGDTTVVNSTNATAPVVDIRQAATLVKVKDQDTVVMGGLVEEETTQTRKKIPFLGDIPGLGVLFTGMVDAKIIRELVFFVSPTVVTDVPIAVR